MSEAHSEMDHGMRCLCCGHWQVAALGDTGVICASCLTEHDLPDVAEVASTAAAFADKQWHWCDTPSLALRALHSKWCREWLAVMAFANLWLWLDGVCDEPDEPETVVTPFKDPTQRTVTISIAPVDTHQAEKIGRQVRSAVRARIATYTWAWVEREAFRGRVSARDHYGLFFRRRSGPPKRCVRMIRSCASPACGSG